MEDRQWCKECYENNDVFTEVKLIADYRMDVDVYICEICGCEMVWNKDECEWENEIKDYGIGFGIEGE